MSGVTEPGPETTASGSQHLGQVWCRIKNRLQEHEWWIVGVLSGLTLLAGTVGFYQLYQGTQEPRSWSDCFYLGLQLFTLESGSATGDKSWYLEVARLAAPGLLGYTTVRAVWGLVREQLRCGSLRFWRDHVVICGLGEKGRQLTEDFLQRGDRVVVLEADANNPHIPSCRDRGALILVGDASSPPLLARARVPAAKHLVAVTGDDGINVEIAVQAQKLYPGPPECRIPAEAAEPGPAAAAGTTDGHRCYVHLKETALRALLNRSEELTGSRGACRARLFDIYENAARLVFREFPPDVYARRQKTQEVHLVIIGFGRLGENLALQAARVGHYASGKPIRLTVVDAVAEKRLQNFLARYPRFTEICFLQWHTMRMEDPEFVNLTFLGPGTPPSSPTMAFICVENEEAGFLAALHLYQRLQEPPFPILLRVRSLTGLAGLARAGMGNFPPGGGIYPFGSIRETCNLRLLLDEELDDLAKKMHATYVALEESRGKTVQDNPSMQPFEELAEDLKQSNLLQAEHLWVKVRILEDRGYRLRERQPEDGENILCKLGEEEEDLLARLEHDRWNAERWLAGWQRCDDLTIPKEIRTRKRLNPWLRPYKELPEDIKEYDREHVRNIPRFLWALGKVLEPPANDAPRP